MAEILSGLNKVQGAGVPNGLTRINRFGGAPSFLDVLKVRLEKEAGVKFSAHAIERLRDREITLETGVINRLSNAVSRAGEKGASDSLILIDEMAFIVSIKNQTVVTAMAGEGIKDNVFTNIDSTVIA
ncbi:TIGR02530 family flagellar biosynthesis protein [Candidatus Latescibacterota bacterium]